MAEVSSTKLALQSEVEKSSRLEKEIDASAQAHVKQVKSLEERIKRGEDLTGELQRELETARINHEKALSGLQSQLKVSEDRVSDLSSTIERHEEELRTRQTTIDGLKEDVSSLTSQAKELTHQLEESGRLNHEAQEELRGQLSEQQIALVKAEQLASSTAKTLEQAEASNRLLQQQVDELDGANNKLSDKISELEAVAREREQEILRAREAEARERQSALLKQAEIEQLVRQLAEVAEQKALLVLKPLIKESDNVALLTAIYSANNPAGLNLDDIGWNDGAHVEQVASVRAIGVIVWQAQIQTAADERLTALSQQASNALKATIRDSRDLAALRAIAAAAGNGDLRVGVGFNEHVGFLRGATAYEGIRDEAGARLVALSLEATNTLKGTIRGSRDLVVLRAVAAADRNAALLGRGFDDSVNALHGPTAFEGIRDEAIARLGALELEAKAALIAEVNGSHDVELLTRVAAVVANDGLGDLNAGHVAALTSVDAFRDIKARAQARLDANQAAIVALTDFINGCDDARFLEAVSGEARTNEFLEVTFRMFRKGNAEHLRALIKDDAHTQFADLARARLLVLDAARHRRPDEPDPRIIAQEKAIHALQREIAVSKDKELLTEISTANSNAALNHNWHQVDELNLRNIQALVQDDAYLRVREAASRRIVALRDERNEKRDAYSDPGRYAATLAADRTTLTGINRRVGAIGTVDDKVRSELRQLGAMNPMHWFSPAFRGAAKKNAIAMEAHFTELATTCKVIVDYLVPLRNELFEQINSIPVNMDGFTEPQKKALQDRKALLTTYLRKVETELALYKPVYTQLYGDPRAVDPVSKDGILETIRRAKTDEGALEVFPFKSAATDHPMDERAAHFRAGYTSSATTVSARSTTLGLGAHQARYAAGDAFKAGHFREHTINPDAARTGRYSGSYIEERASSYRTSLANASEYLSDLKLTITKFPEAPHGVPEDDPQLVEDRIHFAFACAVTLLSAFSEPPTASNQVILRGFEEKEMGYIWTALMTLGSEIPSMQFNHKAINVISPTFKPANELGTFYGYSSSSYQEALFKPHKGYVDNLLKGIKEACAERVIHQKTLEKADKLATSISSAYKSTFKQTMDELRENQDKGPEIFGR
ncbi:interaptin [Legionella feeleii]|uniref:Interaptin n=1 Tax=Legionella feeleii TaxID=453 RepID=A0A0W0TKE7_9GAMM|nr:hypothetical protein [Legionella feeleii]KTC95995.1 interaptin [Legionella feeleii]